jgi:hypothetical protein
MYPAMWLGMIVYLIYGPEQITAWVDAPARA